MLAKTIFEDKVEKIIHVTKRFSHAPEEVAIPYLIVGGLAVFVHVDARDPMAARLTRDVDVAPRLCDRSGGRLGAHEANQLPPERPGAHSGPGSRWADHAEIEQTLTAPLLARLKEVRSKR